MPARPRQPPGRRHWRCLHGNRLFQAFCAALFFPAKGPPPRTTCFSGTPEKSERGPVRLAAQTAACIIHILPYSMPKSKPFEAAFLPKAPSGRSLHGISALHRPTGSRRTPKAQQRQRKPRQNRRAARCAGAKLPHKLRQAPAGAEIKRCQPGAAHPARCGPFRRGSAQQGSKKQNRTQGAQHLCRGLYMVQAGRGVNKAQHCMQVQRPAGSHTGPQCQRTPFALRIHAPGRKQAHCPQGKKPYPAQSKAQRRQHFALRRNMVAGKLGAIQRKAHRRPQAKSRACGAEGRTPRCLSLIHI